MDGDMWLFVMLLAVSTSTLVAENDAQKEALQVLENCKKETGFQETLLSIKNEGAPKDAKCYLACIMEKKGVLSKDGVFDKEKAKAVVLKEYPQLKDKVFKVIEECVNEVNSKNLNDNCEKGYAYVTCRRSKLGIQT